MYEALMDWRKLKVGDHVLVDPHCRRLTGNAWITSNESALGVIVGISQPRGPHGLDTTVYVRLDRLDPSRNRVALPAKSVRETHNRTDLILAAKPLIGI